jgi:hypothetical protein
VTTILRPHLYERRPPTDVVRIRGVDVEVVYRSGGREKVREEGRCRLCLRPWRIRPPSRHHLVPKSWFADRLGISTIRDCDANVVPLCRPCHDWIEQDVSGRRMLRKVLGAAEVRLALLLRGRDWFDGRYPPSASSSAAELVQASRRRRESRRV